MLIYWHTHKDIPLTCKTSTIVPLFVRSYCSSSVVIVIYIYIYVCVFRHKKILSYYEHAMPDETLDYVIAILVSRSVCCTLVVGFLLLWQVWMLYSAFGYIWFLGPIVFSNPTGEALSHEWIHFIANFHFIFCTHYYIHQIFN